MEEDDISADFRSVANYNANAVTDSNAWCNIRFIADVDTVEDLRHALQGLSNRAHPGSGDQTADAVEGKGLNAAGPGETQQERLETLWSPGRPCCVQPEICYKIC